MSSRCILIFAATPSPAESALPKRLKRRIDRGGRLCPAAVAYHRSTKTGEEVPARDRSSRPVAHCGRRPRHLRRPLSCAFAALVRPSLPRLPAAPQIPPVASHGRCCFCPGASNTASATHSPPPAPAASAPSCRSPPQRGTAPHLYVHQQMAGCSAHGFIHVRYRAEVGYTCGKKYKPNSI